jgi:hypothetical protein
LCCKCILVVVLILAVNATLNLVLNTKLIALLYFLICLLFFLKILLNIARFLFSLIFLFILIFNHYNFIFLVILNLFRAKQPFLYFLSIEVFNYILELFCKLAINFSTTQSLKHNSTIRRLCNKNPGSIKSAVTNDLIEKQTSV